VFEFILTSFLPVFQRPRPLPRFVFRHVGLGVAAAPGDVPCVFVSKSPMRMRRNPLLLSRDGQLEQNKMENAVLGIPLAFVALFAVCVYLIRRRPFHRRRSRDSRQARHDEYVNY
jgi:hypothetical protein